ncbi:MAG: carbamoylphosphate synthase large subunit [Chloroflexi bacterium]|nr:carbamoylphosphate synthase large subunit [Chloroflexota bacterium]
MANILLTGGRAPATLDLARAFHRAGHTVFMAESLRGHLSQPSAAVKANFFVPAPRQNKEAFLVALKKIVVENKIDLLIPTCEEIFYVSMGRDDLPCKVFAEPINKLNQFHNKWDFVVNAIGLDLYAPETILISSQDDLLHAYAHWRELVLKPVYSRFAARTLILPPLQKALSTLTFDSPWIAQEFIDGNQYCSYSVCHNGVVHAHTTYPSRLTAGQGATVAFEHVEHPAISAWVKTFVRENHFTGQIAFDFVQTADGQLFALECNPRATSGVHLLASHPQFVDAFIDPQPACITPADKSTHMLSTAMLMYALPRAIMGGQFFHWLKTFFTSNDVILDFRDPLPFLLQFKSIFAYLSLARKEKITALEASTFDIEWNGGNQ